MPLSRLISLVFTLFISNVVVAAAPQVGSPLATLEIAERGEIVATADEKFDYVPWSSANAPAKVHVIQYFGATLSDRDIFEPFTDLLQESFEPGTVHVTTVLNLDAAMWGTKGMVVRELKKNKKAHPEATIVADADAVGVSTWELGKKGVALMILDAQGTLLSVNRGALNKEELAPAIELIRKNLPSSASIGPATD